MEYFLKDGKKLAAVLKAVCAGCCLDRQTKASVPYVPRVIKVKNLFERVQIDLIDMAPDSDSELRKNIPEYRYILSIIECFSRYCFLYPLRKKTAEEVRTSLFHFLLRKGTPRFMQCDNGKEFVNKLVEHIVEEGGTTIIHGSPYHPQSQVSYSVCRL